jgi:hypothetical protein
MTLTQMPAVEQRAILSGRKVLFCKVCGWWRVFGHRCRSCDQDDQAA